MVKRMGSEDLIRLKGVRANGRHGVFDFERRSEQPFLVDVTLEVDSSRAVEGDDITATISYADVAERVVEVVEGPSVRLIETLAHRVASAVLALPGSRRVEVTIHKPDAPLPVEVADVSVTVRRANPGAVPGNEEHRAVEAPAPAVEPSPSAGDPHEAECTAVERTAIIALGGNLGNVPVTLAAAVEDLDALDGVRVEDLSPLVRSRAVLEPDQEAQPDYWNAVVRVRTRLAAEDLLARMHDIEAAHGRERLEHWGARTLDLDLITVEGVESDTDTLTLPHPRAAHRAFVLAPWTMLDPEAVLPGHGRVEDLLLFAEDHDGIRDAVAEWWEDPEDVMGESDAVLAGRGPADDEESAERRGDAADTPASAGTAEAPVLDPREDPRVPALDDPTVPSRLDGLPEASRANLRPEAQSLASSPLWAALWAEWAAPTGPHEEPAADGAATGRSDAQTGEEGAVDAPGADVAGRAERSRPQDRLPEWDSLHEELVEVASKAAPVVAPDPGTRTHERPASRRRAPRWFPLPGRHRDEQGPDSSRAEPTGTSARETGTAHERPLPSWDFSSAEVMVVDDLPDATVRRRSILDPDVPPSARGPVEDDPAPTTTAIMRRVTMRPTVTGAIPVIPPPEDERA